MDRTAGPQTAWPTCQGWRESAGSSSQTGGTRRRSRLRSRARAPTAQSVTVFDDLALRRTSDSEKLAFFQFFSEKRSVAAR